MLGVWFGNGWAQPVVSKRRAFYASVLFTISRVTGYRILNHRKHLAWMRACGLPGAGRWCTITGRLQDAR